MSELYAHNNTYKELADVSSCWLHPVHNKPNFHFGSQCCDSLKSSICRGFFFFFTNVVGAITSGKAGRYSNCQMQQSREEITLGGFTSKLWDCNSWCLRRDNLRIRPGWVIACWGSQYCWWGKGILEKGTPSHAKGMCETSKGFWCLSFCAPRPAFYIPQEKPRILWDRRII